MQNPGAPTPVGEGGRGGVFAMRFTERAMSYFVSRTFYSCLVTHSHQLSPGYGFPPSYF